MKMALKWNRIDGVILCSLTVGSEEKFVSPDLLRHPLWYTPLLISVQMMSW